MHGTAKGDLDRAITGVSSPGSASAADIVFIASTKYASQMAACAAGAALVPRGIDAPSHMAVIEVDDPARAMMLVVDLLLPARRAIDGISDRAHIGTDVTLGAGVAIGPFAAIGDRVRIGDRTEIHAGVTIGADTTIGDDCVLHAGAHVYHEVAIGSRVILHSGAVIGADGFGYVREESADDPDGDPARHRKVRQVGRVIIEDDVEIGANSTIDRATYDATRIGRGTKIDNLVTIGHNCTIGRHCIIVGQAGISGSTALGNYVVVAGQAGLTNHLTVGDGVIIGAQAGVTRSLKAGETVLGSPAVEVRRAKKALALIDSLPDMKKAIADHHRRLARLEDSSPDAPDGD